MRGQVNACRCALLVRMCLVSLMRARMHGGSQLVGRWSAFFLRIGNKGMLAHSQCGNAFFTKTHADAGRWTCCRLSRTAR